MIRSVVIGVVGAMSLATGFIQDPEEVAILDVAVLAREEVVEGRGLDWREHRDSPARLLVPPVVFDETEPPRFVGEYELGQAAAEKGVPVLDYPCLPRPLPLTV